MGRTLCLRGAVIHGVQEAMAQDRLVGGAVQPAGARGWVGGWAGASSACILEVQEGRTGLAAR